MSERFVLNSIYAVTPEEVKAAGILSAELVERTGRSFPVTDKKTPDGQVVFRTDESVSDKDSYRIDGETNGFVFNAPGIRGFIYAIGLFLRKCEFKNGDITLTADITGNYAPAKKIRGHQLGYRPLSNTYDKWTVENYKRYYLDLMYFGTGTVEHMAYVKGVSDKNAIMLFDEEEMLQKVTAAADELDLNVSLWSPNCENDFETAEKNRRRAYKTAARLNDVFVPGGDPGDLPPEQLFQYCKSFSSLLNEAHPGARLWISAQQPHNQPGWGEAFIAELKKQPEGVAGVITGPNHAFLPHELRKKVPQSYPLRFYPDITHNVRCEYPVHFTEDDWHYALTVVNGRESVNPRLSEYALLHKLTHRYFEGSVSYSEGVNDDINKALYSALEYTPGMSVREVAEDYVRLFFYGSDVDTAVNAVLGLERNWEGNPEENPQIENTCKAWQSLAEDNGGLKENWRWVQGMFRAVCDNFVKQKLLFENSLIKKAYALVKKNELLKAEEILRTPLPASVTAYRSEMDGYADDLFRLIGQQLGTKKYFADSWERGAVLDTCDLPLTDRTYLLNKFKLAEKMPAEKRQAYLLRIFDRNRVENDEYYYSFALEPLKVLGIRQVPDFYMDFQGDHPGSNTGELPVCLFRLFDHFVFRFVTGGLRFNTDYILTVTYKDSPNGIGEEHTVTVNGHVIYKGAQFGGERCVDFEEEQLPRGYTAVMYRIPAAYIENGCIELEISEPNTGFEIGEFRLTKKPYRKETDL